MENERGSRPEKRDDWDGYRQWLRENHPGLKDEQIEKAVEAAMIGEAVEALQDYMKKLDKRLRKKKSGKSRAS